MPEDATIDPSSLFALAADVLEALLGESFTCEPCVARRMEMAKRDLTVIMGLTGEAPYSFCVEMDGEAVVAFGEAMLRRLGGMDLKSVAPEEAPDLLRGAIEELANRTVSKIAAKLERDLAVPWRVTPPVCLFGGDSPLGDPLEGMTSRLRSVSGTIDLTLARERTGA